MRPKQPSAIVLLILCGSITRSGASPWLPSDRVPPACISPHVAVEAASTVQDTPGVRLCLEENFVVFHGLSDICYWVDGIVPGRTHLRESLSIDARTGIVTWLNWYGREPKKGSADRIDLLAARETALAFASRNYHGHSLGNLKLVTDGEPREGQVSSFPYCYRFEWADAVGLPLQEPRRFCRVYISPVTGAMVGFGQDSDGYDIKINTTPKVTQEEALEKARKLYRVEKIWKEETYQRLLVLEDSVGEQYLAWDVNVNGTNPKVYLPDDPSTPLPVGGTARIDALTGEILVTDPTSFTGGAIFAWPEHRGIGVSYFSIPLKLYQPPIRKSGRLYLNRGFFPPFLVTVKVDWKHGSVRLESAKGERNLAIGKQAFLINGRLLLPAELLVKLSPENVTVDETDPNSIDITWNYEHRRTPYPKPTE